MKTLDRWQVKILKRISPGEPNVCSGDVYRNKSKLRILLGDAAVNSLAGKVVIDFGCGEGMEAIEIARSGAARVIGIDIRENVLQVARRHAAQAGLSENICSFAQKTNERADAIVSIDSFEHFSDPGHILKLMHALLKPGGECLISFGPTWYHPLGGHLFSVFPWAHLMFSERALISWRSAFKTDGATRFGEVEGGLNQMTISRFERLVAASPFQQVRAIETVPIRKLRPLHNRLTREFTSALVRCRLK